MKTGLLSMLVIGVLSAGLGVIYATDSLAEKEKEASPTIKERLTKETITGTLMNISMKDNDSKEHKIQSIGVRNRTP